MAQRVYKPAAIYDSRIIGLRNLWEPSREYMGRPTEKPNYLASIIVKKTRANWWEEPALANFTEACQALYTASLSHIPFQQVTWPIKDGDVADVGRANPEWRKGHWLLTGSSTSPIEVSIVQGGVPIPLRNRAGVKSGDYVMVAVALAVKANDPRGVKCYLNKVVFTAEGEEIVVGSGGISAAELMEHAKAQGMNVTGFGGGGAPAQQGFGFAAMGGSAHQPAPVQPGQTAAFPSNGSQTGFAPPPVQPPAAAPQFGGQNFAAPKGFPPRQ